MSNRNKKSTELPALKGRIREKGSSYKKLSEMLTMSEATFSQKINGHSCFTCVEVNFLLEELEISTAQIALYFFPSQLRKETKTA